MLLLPVCLQCCRYVTQLVLLFLMSAILLLSLYFNAAVLDARDYLLHRHKTAYVHVSNCLFYCPVSIVINIVSSFTDKPNASLFCFSFVWHTDCSRVCICLLEVKTLNDIALLNNSPQSYEASRPYRVICHAPETSERTRPGGWYSIYLPRRDGRLSWSRSLVRYGLHVSRQWPIQVVTGPDVEQLRWSRTTC